MLYVSASKIIAAGRVADRAQRVALMARTMQEAAAAHGSCDLKHLSAAGFTAAESLAFADDARALLSGRHLSPPAGRGRLGGSRAGEGPGELSTEKEAARLLDQARRVRRRLRDRARRKAKRALAACGIRATEDSGANGQQPKRAKKASGR